MFANVTEEVVFVYIPINFEEGTASQFIAYFVYNQMVALYVCKCNRGSCICIHSYII